MEGNIFDRIEIENFFFKYSLYMHDNMIKENL